MKNQSPLITVIIPVYNVEKYLRECIESIIGQDYLNTEIILVDDFSTDKSGEICDSYAETANNISVIHNTANQGLGLTRNVGIEKAKGEYVAFIDSDDFISNNHLSTLLQEIRISNSDVCYCGYTSYNGNACTEYRNVLGGSVIGQPELLTTTIPSMCGRTRNHEALQMSSCMALYSLKLLNENRIRFHSEREYISEDLLFNIDFLKKANKAVFSNHVGYYYRFNPLSLSHSYRKDRFEKQKVMTRKIVEITKELGIYDISKTNIINTQLAWGRYCIRMEQARWHEIGFRESLKMIKGICNDPDIIEYSQLYVKGNDKRSSEMLNNLIRKKQSFLLWCVMAVKNIKH